MSLEFENKLASFIKEHDLLGLASKVVLAVSGGADSTALLYAMQAIKAKNSLNVQFVCAHVNHQLRGAASDLDEAFIVTEASRLKLDVATKRVDVRGFARDHKLSIETAARQCRMKALIDIAKANHCDRIATAHQQNDNAETVLHRLVRGTGYRGLGGIWPKRTFAEGVTFIRPLLCATRKEVLSYLQARHLKWRTDHMNADCAYRRNFIRHRLLPILQQECKDSVVETLSMLAHSARRFYCQVCERADEVWAGLVECTPERTTLDLKRFQSQPQPVKIELIRRCLNRLGCGQGDLIQRHYERIVQLTGQDVTGKEVQLPGGFIVRRDYGDVIFSRNKVPRCEEDVSPPVELKVPGQTRFGQYLIETVICKAVETGADPFSSHFDCRSAAGSPERRNLPSDKQQVSDAAGCLDYARHDRRSCIEQFDLEKVKLPLSVRFRRPGDRFVPLGLNEEKKIGKFLTAQRVPHNVRRQIMLVEDGEKIIWVWPIRISEQVKLTAGTRKILQLQITKTAGQ